MTTVGLGTRHRSPHAIYAMRSMLCGEAVLDRCVHGKDSYTIQYKAKRTARRDTLATHAMTPGHRASDRIRRYRPELTDCTQLLPRGRTSRRPCCAARSLQQISL